MKLSFSLPIALGALVPFIASAQPDPVPHLPPPVADRVERVEVKKGNRGGGVHVGPPGADNFMHEAFEPMRMFFNNAEATRNLIVASSKLEANKAAELEEDLSVMARLLGKALKRSHAANESEDQALGIVVSSLGGSRSPQNLYLEGHGALFIMNVKFPLTPQGKPTEAKTEEKEDSDWEQTKRELQGRRTPGAPVMGHSHRPGPAFDAAKVEALKTELISALKNGANIRHLKDEEFVTVVIQGADGGGEPISHRGHMQMPGLGGGNHNGEKGERGTVAVRAHEVVAVRAAGREAARPSMMVLRARKSDINAFSQGNQKVSDFEKKIVTNVY